MPRFLTLADVAEQLQINSPAAYALVRSGELKAIQVGGRGQWRVEEKMLEQYIEERYAEASRSQPALGDLIMARAVNGIADTSPTLRLLRTSPGVTEARST